MTERGKQHDHDPELGAALRSLAEPSERDGFWIELERQMAELDGDIASDESPGDNVVDLGRWHRNRGRILLAAAVVALALAGAAMLTASFTDDSTSIDAVIDGDVDNKSGTDDKTGGIPARASVDYWGEPTITALQPGAFVVGTASESDVILATVPVPNSDGTGCEGLERHELVGLTSSGVGLPIPSEAADFNVVVPGPNNRFVLGYQCEESTEVVAVGSIDASGNLVVERTLANAYEQISDLALLSRPVWSSTGNTVRVNGLIVDKGPSLVNYDVSTGQIVDTEATPGRLLAEFANGVRAVQTEEGLSVAGTAISLIDNNNLLYVAVELSPDRTLLAAWNQTQLKIVDNIGTVRWEGQMRVPVTDAAWTPNELLLVASSDEAELTVVDYRPGGVTTPLPFDTLDADGWFDVGIADHGRVVTLSGFGRTTEAISYALRFDDTNAGSIVPGEPGDAAVESSDDPEAGQDVDPETAGGEGFYEHRLTLRGMGPIDIGMTVTEAAAALDQAIDVVIYDAVSDECHYGSITGEENSPAFMVRTEPGAPAQGGVIARIELKAGQKTTSGIGIGSTIDEVVAAYGRKIEVSPNRYTDEDVLTYIPADKTDANYRLIMETVDGKVSAIRAGRLPEVAWIEGCL